MQRRNFYQLTAEIETHGRYSHSGTMIINVGRGDDSASEKDADAIAQAMRDMADWLYSTLESEHDYLLSDDQVDESIAVNEYEFEADGTIYAGAGI